MKKSKKIYDSIGMINQFICVLGLVTQLLIWAYISVYIYVYLSHINLEYMIINPFEIIYYVIEHHNIRLIFFSLLILVNIFVTSYYLLKKNYYIEKITNEQYQKIANRKLIHYANYIPNTKTKTIFLAGNNSARANYTMRFKDAKRPFVWFHVSKKDEIEPDMESFYFSHLFEKKRKYKVIIEVNDLDINMIYVRGMDKCIVYKGDYFGKAQVEEEFKWYSNKIMFRAFLDGLKIDGLGLMIFVFVIQAIGAFRDKIDRS